MKILFISTLWDEKGTGGRESYARQLASHLKEDNEIVVVNTHRRPRTQVLFKEGIKFYKVFHYNILFYEDYYLRSLELSAFTKALWHLIDTFNILSAFRVLTIIKKEKPDVIHIQDIKGFSTLLCLLLGFFKKNVVLTLHAYEFLCIAGVFLCPMTQWEICKKDAIICKLYRFLKRIMISSSIHTVIAPSKFILEMHKKYGFFQHSKTAVIPNFVDIKPMHLVKSRNEDTFNLLYIGRLCKDKGTDILIMAFKELQEDFLRLHIVGIGPEEAALKNLARTDKRIVFHGTVEHEEVENFYKIAHLVIVPSIWYENCPMVILESFSYAVPVIGSRIGGIPEFIEEVETGLTFNPGDVSDLRQKIQFLLHNRTRIEELGIKVQKLVEENLNFDKHYERLKATYETVK